MHTINTNEQDNKKDSQQTPMIENPRENPTDSLTHQELESLRNGNHRAYQKLYTQFVKPLIRYITMLSHSEILAEELTQDIFTTVWIDRQKIDPQKNIRGYLFTVARHTMADYYRKQKVRTNYLKQQDFSENTTHSTDASLIAKDMEQHITDVVNHMPKQRRKIFELSFRGWSSNEIATHLSLSQKAVEKQISYARRSIRESITIA
ncbi:MAG: RNA polymerase sigma-70 factor [Odoribacteraceae bacterium]|jgi:RNA polymerase sigma-70 factor (ECF subfamily)|nr:RNA polymerase sigma-70 factor [Odoribacteraceae bacterium]